MADSIQDQISGISNTLSKKTDDLWNLITYGAKSYIDKETRADDTNIPDVADVQSGQASQVTSNANGNQLAQSSFSPTTIMVMVGVGVVGLIVLKKAKVL